MNSELWEWKFNSKFVKSFFYSQIKSAKNSPLLHWFCFYSGFYYYSRIVEFVQSKNLNRLQNIITELFAFFELIGQAEDINGEVAKYRAVTPGDIRRTAQAAFTHENCCVVHYLAKP